MLVEGDGGARAVRELSGGERHTTNNRMELTAAAAALEAVADEAPVGIRTSVAVVTDSQYLRRGITEWLRRWMARGWLKADGQPVENVDLWQRLAAAAARCHVQWHWVKGHAGHKWNEKADRLATAARERVAGGGSRRQEKSRVGEERAAGGGEPERAVPGEGRGGGSWVGGESLASGVDGAGSGPRGAAAGGDRSPIGQRWPAVAPRPVPPAGPAVRRPSPAPPVPLGTDVSQAPDFVLTQKSSLPPSYRVVLRVSGRAGGSWAARVVSPEGEATLLQGRAPGASANLLDLHAALAALESLPPAVPVQVVTGSDYLRLGATTWIHDWRRRGWRTASGKAVANQDEWQRLAALLAKRRVDWPEPDDADREELERVGEALSAGSPGSG